MKLNVHEQFIVDERGKPKGVILPVLAYQRMLELIKDLGDVQYVRKHRKEDKKPIEAFIAQLKEEKLV